MVHHRTPNNKKMLTEILKVMAVALIFWRQNLTGHSSRNFDIPKIILIHGHFKLCWFIKMFNIIHSKKKNVRKFPHLTKIVYYFCQRGRLLLNVEQVIYFLLIPSLFRVATTLTASTLTSPPLILKMTSRRKPSASFHRSSSPSFQQLH